ncbi:hypothetical protein B0H11DRAFT_2240362 [Mycena galericulata]|nr:hypothetical protein B0H11DRAFT_2240362 [Mycena galericulata]
MPLEHSPPRQVIDVDSFDSPSTHSSALIPIIVDAPDALEDPLNHGTVPVPIDVDALTTGPGSHWTWPICIDAINPTARFKRHKLPRSPVASSTIEQVRPVYARIQGISSLPYELIETIFRFTTETDDDFSEDIRKIIENIRHLHSVCKSWRVIAGKAHVLRAFISVAFRGFGQHPGSIDTLSALKEQIKAAGQCGLRIVFRFPDQGGEKYSNMATVTPPVYHAPCAVAAAEHSSLGLDCGFAASDDPDDLPLSHSLTRIHLKEHGTSPTLLLLQRHANTIMHLQWEGGFSSDPVHGTNSALRLPIALPALSNLTFQNIAFPPPFHTPVIEILVLQGSYPPFRSLLALCQHAPLRIFDCTQANVTTRNLINLLLQSPYLVTMKISTGKDVQDRRDFYRALRRWLGSNYFWQGTQPFRKLILSDPVPVREAFEYDHLQNIARLREPLTTTFHSKGWLLGVPRYGEQFVDEMQVDIITANQLQNHVMWIRTWTRPQGRPFDTDLVLVINNEAIFERCLRRGLIIGGEKLDAVYPFRRPTNQYRGG